MSDYWYSDEKLEQKADLWLQENNAVILFIEKVVAFPKKGWVGKTWSDSCSLNFWVQQVTQRSQFSGQPTAWDYTGSSNSSVNPFESFLLEEGLLHRFPLPQNLGKNEIPDGEGTLACTGPTAPVCLCLSIWVWGQRKNCQKGQITGQMPKLVIICKSIFCHWHTIKPH